MFINLSNRLSYDTQAAKINCYVREILTSFDEAYAF